MATATDLVWQRARVTRWRDGVRLSVDRRARFLIDGATARVFQQDGMLAAEAQIDGTAGIAGRTVTLTTDTGETWMVEKMGCGCGGGA